MSLADEIRNEIENIKELKITVGDINSHLSVLEGLCRNRNQKAVDDAYKRGYEDGKDSVVNGCDGCRYKSKQESGRHPCFACARYYKDDYYEPIQKDEITVGVHSADRP